MPQLIESSSNAIVAAIPDKEITPLSLIQDALHKNVSPEILKELVALQQSMVRFSWEAQERQAKIDFDDALNACQSRIGRIAPNQKRENSIMWADYAQLDRAVRPVYIAAGFSISFSEVDGPEANRMRMRATLARGGVSREYFADISRIPPNSKMNQTDADAGAASRVKRYLLLDIFNIAIGIDADDKKPFVEVSPSDELRLQEWVEAIRECGDLNMLRTVFADAYKYAKTIGEGPKRTVTDVYEASKRKLGGAQ